MELVFENLLGFVWDLFGTFLRLGKRIKRYHTAVFILKKANGINYLSQNSKIQGTLNQLAFRTYPHASLGFKPFIKVSKPTTLSCLIKPSNSEDL